MSNGRVTSGTGRVATRLLLGLVAAAALGPVIFPPNQFSVVPPGVRLQSGILWVLCWLPSVVYLRQAPTKRPPIPLLPIIGVAHGMYYALQLTIGVDNANNVQMINFAPLDPRTDYQAPVTYALWGWVILLLAYAVARQVIRPRPLRIARRFESAALRTWALRLLYAGIAFEVLRQAFDVPIILRGVLTFAAMLGQFGMAVLIVLNVRGFLSPRQRVFLLVGFAMILLLAIGTGSIANAAYATLVAVLAAWVGGQRVRPVWVAGGVLAAAVFVALRGVAMDYREIAWFTNEQLPVSEYLFKRPSVRPLQV